LADGSGRKNTVVTLRASMCAAECKRDNCNSCVLDSCQEHVATAALAIKITIHVTANLVSPAVAERLLTEHPPSVRRVSSTAVAVAPLSFLHISMDLIPPTLMPTHPHTHRLDCAAPDIKPSKQKIAHVKATRLCYYSRQQP
jgi:hypothetical protein